MNAVFIHAVVPNFFPATLLLRLHGGFGGGISSHIGHLRELWTFPMIESAVVKYLGLVNLSNEADLVAQTLGSGDETTI